MNDILKTLRSFLILGFIFYLIYLFAKFLLIPIFIFILFMKFLKMVNINFKFRKKRKTSKEKQSQNDVIDAEFEDLD